MKIIETKGKILTAIKDNICKSQKGHTYIKVIEGFCILRPNGRKAISMDLGQTVQIHSGDNIIVFAEKTDYQLKFTVRFSVNDIFLDEEIEILEGDYKKYLYDFSLENSYVTPLLFKQLTGACISGIEKAINEYDLPDKPTVKQVMEFTKDYFPEWHEKFIEGLKEIGHDIN